VQGSDYYRRQADICLALSLMGEDPMIAVALIAMARELLEKAEEAERGAEVPPPHVTDRDPSDDGDARRDESPQ
jgi:hypothetical protein